MSSGMDEERAFARIEQRLASDDPALARRIDVLNGQFTGPAGNGRLRDPRSDGPVTRHGPEKEGTPRATDGGEEPSRTVKVAWTVKVAVVLGVVAAVGLLLTALLSAPGGGDRPPPQPHGMTPPASSPFHADTIGSGVP